MHSLSRSCGVILTDGIIAARGHTSIIIWLLVICKSIERKAMLSKIPSIHWFLLFDTPAKILVALGNNLHFDELPIVTF